MLRTQPNEMDPLVLSVHPLQPDGEPLAADPPPQSLLQLNNQKQKQIFGNDRA